LLKERVMNRRELRNNKMDVECPDCGRKVKVSAATILGHGTEKCPHCGLKFEGDKKAGRKLDNHIKKMQRKFK
jgi:endogenous inhibitor of DNA gyrase (YacG/DUF329 family)